MSRLKRAPHPLKRWMDTNAKTAADVVAMAEAAGFAVGEKYVERIKYGIQRPGYDLAKQLAALTAGVVSVIEIMEYPYGPVSDSLGGEAA